MGQYDNAYIYGARSGINGAYTPVLGCQPVDDGCAFCTYARSVGVSHPASFGGIELKKRGTWTGEVLVIDRYPSGAHRRCRMVGTDIFQPKVTEDQILNIGNRCGISSGYFAFCTKYINRAVYLWKKFSETDRGMRTNIVLGTSVPTQGEVWRINVLRKSNAYKLLMFAPLLEGIGRVNLTGITQVVVNGEIKRGEGARETDLKWIDEIYETCLAQDVRFVCDNLGTYLENKLGLTTASDVLYYKRKRWPDARVAW